jgi:hypothetical protein
MPMAAAAIKTRRERLTEIADQWIDQGEPWEIQS